MIRHLIIVVLLALCAPVNAQDVTDRFPPPPYITSGPRHHLFGYNDRLQFDSSTAQILKLIAFVLPDRLGPVKRALQRPFAMKFFQFSTTSQLPAISDQ